MGKYPFCHMYLDSRDSWPRNRPLAGPMGGDDLKQQDLPIDSLKKDSLMKFPTMKFGVLNPVFTPA